MANSFSKDKMATLFEETAETTSLNLTLSKDLETYDMSDMSDKGRTTSSDGSGADIEWIPQEYRFNVQDGIESTSGDFQDLIDRNIPVRRNKVKRILTQIKTKDLRDPMRLERAKKGMAKDIANAVDVVAYNTMRDRANMAVSLTGDFSYEDAILAESKMLNNGLGRYDKKLCLSIPHYNKVAQALQTASREVAVSDALSRAQVPNLSTFSTMRAEYTSKLAGNASTGLAVNGAQSFTVSTYDASGDFYLDNRQMSLAVTGSTPTTMPVGTKFTIADVFEVNPESRTENEELRTFTVVATGTGSVTISPAIVASGPYQNCSAEASNTAAITILNVADNAASLFYTPESTFLVPGYLPVAQNAGGVETFDGVTDNGLPMRMTFWWDPHGEALNIKTLIFFDVAVVHPEQVGVILDKQV